MTRAVTKIDWSYLLGIPLKPSVAVALTAFRKRYDESERLLTQLREQDKPLEFGQYRQILRNQKIVDEAEKLWRDFKPSKVDVAKQLDVLNQVEAKALEKARETAAQVNAELANLQVTLVNIENARPIDQLTIEDVIQAKPELPEILDKRLQEGKWTVPGYYEKFGKNAVA